MDESRFAQLADQTLEALADAIDDALGDRIDVDLDHGILTLTLDDKSQYVINKHGPMRQIWMSSPVSGASHFGYLETGHWQSTRDPAVDLVATVVAEMHGKYGIALSL